MLHYALQVKSVQSVLIRSTSGGFEPRFKLAENFLFRFSNIVEPIIWSRTVKDSIFLDSNPANIFKAHADYGRGWKNSLAHFRFFLFIVRRLHAINPKIIYACDLDTLIPSLIWRINKRVIIVFDQFDPLSSRTNNRTLSRLIGKLEIYVAKKSDIRITANSSRIPARMIDEWFEMKNVFPIESSYKGLQKIKPPFVLFYGGILAPDRGLLACATAISQEPDWEFHLYGQGFALDLLKDANYPNVFVHQPLPHEELMRKANSSDLFLAMYDPSFSNNKSTASNKLFEAAQLGIPLLSNNGTSLGETVIAFDLGWTVEYDNIQQIRTTLREVSKLSDLQNIAFTSRSFSYFNSQLVLCLDELTRIENRLNALLGEMN